MFINVYYSCVYQWLLLVIHVYSFIYLINIFYKNVLSCNLSTKIEKCCTRQEINNTIMVSISCPPVCYTCTLNHISHNTGDWSELPWIYQLHIRGLDILSLVVVFYHYHQPIQYGCGYIYTTIYGCKVTL